MSVLIAHDEAAFRQKAAQLFLESAVGAVEKSGRFTVALSGGRSPVHLYAALTDDYYRRRVPWDKMLVFWGDERCVPPDDKDSNFKLAQDHLLSKVPVPAPSVFRMPGEMASAFEAGKQYETTLKNVFKTTDRFPRFDFMLNGVGEDGHTASLFPNTPALAETQRWAVGNFVERLNSHRITLTFPVFNAASRVVFLVNGEGKATIVREIFRDDVPGDRYPAQRIQPTNGEALWLLDAGAASKLPDGVRYASAHV